MGLLVDGNWYDKWYDTESTGGRFVRSESQYREWIDAPGSGARFEAEADRYHLYVSLACPWAHRTLILRALKGLEEMVSVSVVHPLMLDNGWTFDPGFEGATGDSLYGSSFMHQIYTRDKADYSGRVTVPVLWDKKRECIVNNESSDIIRMLNTAFDELGAKAGNYYPEALREAIDEVNQRVYDRVNNGVYRAGFATSQEAYEEAVTDLFAELDWLEGRLSTQRYLVGGELTEADIRLFTTLIRFDPVYVSHFKCDRNRIADYPVLSEYLRDIYQHPGVAETVNLDHIRHHYYCSHPTINPSGVIPVGPRVDLMAAHKREEL
ncbi:glutathione S-transferase family protein [Nitrincola alkalilacustris]|uniref:glutathione S-transferase family protein n=1 Tax=Nitrincola alkalilacustris TaxID=1571224 RepID=UPI00124E7AFD|nr:glutathione S-transferase family protein [Nitrincola alkalilacustris]